MNNKTYARIYRALPRREREIINTKLREEIRLFIPFGKSKSKRRKERRAWALSALVQQIQNRGHEWRAKDMMFYCKYEYMSGTNIFRDGYIIIMSTPIHITRDFWRWANNRSRLMPSHFKTWCAVQISSWTPYTVDVAGNLIHGGSSVGYAYEWKYDYPMAQLTREQDAR